MPHVSAKSNEPSIVITSSILGFAPVAIRTPGKIDKEKARSRDLEKVKKEQEIVIESLSEEYQGVTSRCQRLQQQIYDGDQSSRRGSESGSGEDRRGRSEGASRREGRRAAREDELQGEIDDLLDERNSHEDEYRAWEEEKEALTRKADEGEDAFRKAADHAERLNSENEEHLARIEGYESGDLQRQIQELAQNVNDISSDLGSAQGEDRRGRSEGASRREGRRAAREDELQGEIDDLLDERNSHEDEYRAWEEEKEALTRKADEGEDAFRKAADHAERLNSENEEHLARIEGYESGDLQRQIQELAQNVNDISSDLGSAQEGRSRLQISLRENSELCLEMKSRLSSPDGEEEMTPEECKRKIRDLEKLLDDTNASLVSAGLAITTEKEKAASDMESISGRREVVAALQKRVSDSWSRTSGPTDRSAARTARDDGEAPTRRAARRESSAGSLGAERDAANARVADLMAGFQQVLSSLAASADERKGTIARLAAERGDAVARSRGLEDAVEEMRAEAERLAQAASDGSSGGGEGGAGASRTAQDASAHHYNKMKIQDLQSEIDDLKETNARLVMENNSQNTEASARENSKKDPQEDLELEKEEVSDISLSNFVPFILNQPICCI